MVPVMLRLLRRRYKMPWTCLLHSELYLAVQALDLAAVVSLAAGADDRALRLTAEVCVYLASVYLCVCCMALATPPVYIGQKIVRRYASQRRQAQISRRRHKILIRLSLQRLTAAPCTVRIIRFKQVPSDGLIRTTVICFVVVVYSFNIINDVIMNIKVGNIVNLLIFRLMFSVSETLLEA